MNYLEILNHIRQIIGGCFGYADGEFANHPADEQRAVELRNYAIENHISLLQIQEIALGYLYNRRFQGQHIKDQLDDVTTFFGEQLR